MGTFEAKFNEVLNAWPFEIDLSDGEVLSESGFYSENLSIIWNNVEAVVGYNDSCKDMMVWTIYKVLHKKARESFIKNIYKLYPTSIRINEYKSQFYSDLLDSEDYKDVLNEFEKENNI
ncbi:hypothetical protein [Candidatus Clostridium radicumherbarum]|uniref:Uncharacterized protein n=1 Tax=Candidatus Clostridium radicumherbarum TaxID=3381662 RepID=A0ABW8TR64_9CLOT